jgi:two-component system chemotaxis response regulator CheY
MVFGQSKETKGKTVLLVDDSATLRSAAAYALNRSGYKVIQAADGLDGLEKIKEMEAEDTELNMMIVDVNMPRLDGIGFIKEVKKTSYKNIPILVLTTESQYKRKMEGKDAGATGWLIKPFKNQQLLEVVEMLAC